MSRMDENLLNLGRQCAPLLVVMLLGACAAPQKNITPNGTAEPPDTTQSAPLPDESVHVVREPVDADVIYNVLAAEYLGGENDLVGAAQAYAEAAEKSIDPAIAERASRISYAAEQWQALERASARWVELQPDAADAYKLRAVSQLQSGDAEGAVNSLREVLQSIPRVEEAWATVAALISASANQSATDEVVNALLDRDNTNLTAADLYGRSILAFRLERPEQSQALANRAADATDDIDIIRWAAQVSHAEGDSERAMAHYRHALEVAPNDRDLNLAYAELLRLNDRMDEALALLEALPADSATLYTLAVYANSEQREAQTLKYYRRLRELDADGDAEHFFFCGQVAEALERWDDAVSCYRQVKGGRDAENAAIRLGYVLFQAEGLEAATAQLRKLQELENAELVEEAYIAEGQILQEAGDNQAALERLSDGLAVLRDNINLLYARALVAEALGEIFLAEQDLRTIIQLDPQNAPALNALGYTLANRTDRYAEALSLIQQALRIDPDDPATLDSMGWVLYRMGQVAEAEDYLRRALAESPNPEIAAHLGEVLWHMGQEEEALEIWRRAQEMDATDRALVETLERLDVQL